MQKTCLSSKQALNLLSSKENRPAFWSTQKVQFLFNIKFPNILFNNCVIYSEIFKDRDW